MNGGTIKSEEKKKNEKRNSSKERTFKTGNEMSIAEFREEVKKEKVENKSRECTRSNDCERRRRESERREVNVLLRYIALRMKG